MNEDTTQKERATSLRQQAEEQVWAAEQHELADLSREEIRRLLHELRVHQIELEMQNEELRRAQEELDASRARYFDLYDLAPVGYFTLNEKGIILEANLTAATLLGMSRGALVGQPLTRSIWPEDQDIYYYHRKQFFETGAPQVCEVRMVRKDGSLAWMRINTSAGQATDGDPVCRCAMSDITERKEGEEALRESEARLARAQQIAHLGNWGWSLPEQTLIWSDEIYRIFGVDEHFELTYENIEAMIHPDDREFNHQQVRTFLDAVDEVSFEFRIIRPDGNIRHIVQVAQVERDETGQAIRAFGIMQDITERHLAELQSETAFNSMRDAMRQTVRSHRLLLALNQASQAVQRARTPEAIFHTISDEIGSIGYHATILMLTGDTQDLAIAYMSFSPEWIRATERLTGLSAVDYRFHPEPGSLFAQVITRGQAVFSDPGLAAIAESLPAEQYELASRLALEIGAARVVLAPLKVEEQVRGVLAIMGDDLSEEDVLAMKAFANQASIALENAQSLEQVQTGRERMHQLTRQIVLAQEEERKHIARELHDELGQAITAISFDLAAIEAALPPRCPPAIAERLAEAQALIEQLDERVGEMALDLRPAILDDLGLVPALRWFVKGYTGRLKIDVALEIAGLEVRLAPEVETTLYRVTQEALTNVSKHAHATEVRIALRREADRITLSVEDNGRGFALNDVTGWRISPRGIGLLGMQERVAVVGGTFAVQTNVGQGTRLTIEIPL